MAGYGDGLYGDGNYGGGEAVQTADGSSTLPPLAAYVEIVKPDGVTYRWDGESDGSTVPTGLQLSTKRMEGFASASCTLRRRIDRDHPDIELYDDFNVVAHSGEVVWEGRVSAHPRQLDADGHSVEVQATGHMAHAKDRKFRMPYVDRDLSKWQGAGVQRKLVTHISAGTRMEADPSTEQDDGTAALATTLQGPWVVNVVTEGWYDAGSGVNIGQVYYRWSKSSTVASADTNYYWDVFVSDNDLGTGLLTTGSLRAAGPGSGTLTAVGDRRYAAVRFSHVGALGDGTYKLLWETLAVYGDHGLDTHTVSATDAPGVYASDVIGHIVANYCPKLNAAGVSPTSYPIPHLAFNDQTDPYDALLQVNKFHLWDFAVWEDRTLHYGPVDLTDHDWEVRLDDPGVTVDLQGDSAEELANGIVVEFDNVVFAKKETLSPDDWPELADTSLENPVNRHGLKVWNEITLSSPTTRDAALQIGRAALAEFNQAKAPGSISVTGYIRDRQGNLQPGWKVRAGDTLAITDHPNDRPRMITETTWNADSKQLTVAVDSSVKRLDAFLDRVATSLGAAGIAA